MTPKFRNCAQGGRKEQKYGIYMWVSLMAEQIKNTLYISVQFSQSLSRVRLFVTPRTTKHQASLSITTPEVHSNPCPLSRWYYPPSHPLSSPSPPAFNLFQHQGLFQWVNSSHHVAKVLQFQLSTSVLPVNTQDWSPLGWTGWISLQFKGLSRVFSTPQFKSINSLVLSFLYSPTHTCIHDHWKNHSLD